MFNLEILCLIAFCYHGGPVLGRFAGISGLAAEKVIVQENRREAGGSVAVPEKLCVMHLKCTEKLREVARLEVSRQGGIDIRQGLRALIWTLSLIVIVIL